MSKKIQTLIKRLKRLGYSASKPKTVDVVCNMRIEEGIITSQYNSKTYSFCSEHCKMQFDAEPHKFADQ